MALQKTYTQARANLKELLDYTIDSREAVIIHRRKGKMWRSSPPESSAVCLRRSICSVRRTTHDESIARLSVRGKGKANQRRSSNSVQNSALTKSKRPADPRGRFDPDFRDDLRWWVQTDRKVALRLLDLVEAALRDPFDGIEKPEPVKTSEATYGHGD